MNEAEKQRLDRQAIRNTVARSDRTRSQNIRALEERDQTKPAEQQGMFRKFDICRVDGSSEPGGKHHGCRYWVLDLDHDPHAPAAMRAYASDCRATHPLLADDIEAEYGPALTEVGILKACIASLQADANRFHWLCEDHDDAGTREKRNELLARMSVMSYSAASRDIDHSRGAAPENGLKPCQQAQCRYPVCACVSGGVCLPPGGKLLPDLNEDLRDILGRPNFTCISIATRLRQLGQTIKPRAEEEQAAVIHLLLSHYLKHGAAWRETVGAFLDGKPAEDQAAPAAPVISSVHGPDDETPGEAAHQPSGVPR